MLRSKMDGLLKSQDRARIRSGQDLGATLRGAVLQTVWVARLASNPRIYMPLRKCQPHVPCCSPQWSGRLERGRKAVQYGPRGDGTSVRRKVSTSSLNLTDCLLWAQMTWRRIRLMNLHSSSRAIHAKQPARNRYANNNKAQQQQQQ